MSTAKRTRGRQSETGTAPSLPPSKKAKTSKDSHVPTDLAFLTDENARVGKKLQANLTNGVPNTKSNRVDETKTTVADHDQDTAVEAPEIIDISSAEESSEYESSEDEKEQPKVLKNGAAHEEEVDAEMGAEDAVMADAGAEEKEHVDDDEDVGGPSFGDLLHATHPDTIDVQAAFGSNTAESNALVTTGGDRTITAPSANSLGTVLTQALRTNDKELLESCFQTRDNASIRATIQRLQSPLVASLLHRLAERLYKRPGRAGSLLIWVQWSLVAHGGYLASQPEVLTKLKSLSQVIKERAAGLQPLMQLKGKLDLLGAQIELRRDMQATRAAQYDSDEEEENVIYVEGEDESSSEDDEADSTVLSNKQRRIANKRNGLDPTADESDEDDTDLPLTNGIADHLDQESSEDEDEAAGGMFDDEAEETSDDEDEEASDDDEDDVVESEDDDITSASEDEGPPPVKAPKPQQRPAGRRK